MYENENHRTDAVESAQQEAAEYPPLLLEVTVRPVSPTGNLVGMADIKINGAFLIRGCKVLTGENGLFVGYPSRKAENGEYRDIAFPVTKEARDQINTAVIDGYNTAIAKMREILFAHDPKDDF